MFAYLEGALSFTSPSLVHLDIGGLGYEVNITLQTYSKIQHAEHCRLFTHLQVREDAWVLYGFATELERTTFRALLSISGVGAATARIILSSLTPQELEQAVNTESIPTLQKVKGVGAKTAQRIILELKGKLTPGELSPANKLPLHNTTADDALIALMNLGIGRGAATDAIKKAGLAEETSVESLIKAALRQL